MPALKELPTVNVSESTGFKKLKTKVDISCSDIEEEIDYFVNNLANNRDDVNEDVEIMEKLITIMKSNLINEIQISKNKLLIVKILNNLNLDKFKVSEDFTFKFLQLIDRLLKVSILQTTTTTTIRIQILII
jgi:hypothetical protein